MRKIKSYIYNYFNGVDLDRLGNMGLFRKFFYFIFYKFLDARQSDDGFKEYGLTIYTGRQGAGKTSALVDYLNRMRVKYPDVIIVTNFGYAYEDIPFTDLSQFLTIRNGTDGVIFAIDEIQNEFDSVNWRSMPSGFLREITQQRKQRIKVVGTSQVFTRVTKALREQAFEVVVCYTYAGRWTFTKTFDAQEYNDVIDSPEGKKKLNRLSRHSFIQTDKFRSAYDTYAKIESLEREGFKAIESQ